MTENQNLHIQELEAEVVNHKNTIAVGDVPRTCIALRMRLANRVITKAYDDALRPFGLRVTQLALLAMAEDRGILRQSELCEQLQISDSALSRNLERMKVNGWIEPTGGETAREHPYRITKTGRKLLLQALPAWQQAQQKAEELLGSRAIQSLERFANKSGFST